MNTTRSSATRSAIRKDSPVRTSVSASVAQAWVRTTPAGVAAGSSLAAVGPDASSQGGRPAGGPPPLSTAHAHPDDEPIGTGGLMAKSVAAGHRVVLVTCTRGELGDIVVEEMNTPENHRRR